VAFFCLKTILAALDITGIRRKKTTSRGGFFAAFQLCLMAEEASVSA
jgi:hypothetical protein